MWQFPCCSTQASIHCSQSQDTWACVLLHPNFTAVPSCPRLPSSRHLVPALSCLHDSSSVYVLRWPSLTAGGVPQWPAAGLGWRRPLTTGAQQTGCGPLYDTPASSSPQLAQAGDIPVVANAQQIGWPPLVDPKAVGSAAPCVMLPCRVPLGQGRPPASFAWLASCWAPPARMQCWS